MKTTAEAWAALQAALGEFTPGCADIDEFTRDDLDEQQKVWAASICNDCPLFAECSEYATAARPATGFWAGRERTGRK